MFEHSHESAALFAVQVALDTTRENPYHMEKAILMVQQLMDESRRAVNGLKIQGKPWKLYIRPSCSWVIWRWQTKKSLIALETASSDGDEKIGQESKNET